MSFSTAPLAASSKSQSVKEESDGNKHKAGVGLQGNSLKSAPITAIMIHQPLKKVGQGKPRTILEFARDLSLCWVGKSNEKNKLANLPGVLLLMIIIVRYSAMTLSMNH